MSSHGKRRGAKIYTGRSQVKVVADWRGAATRQGMSRIVGTGGDEEGFSPKAPGGGEALPKP